MGNAEKKTDRIRREYVGSSKRSQWRRRKQNDISMTDGNANQEIQIEQNGGAKQGEIPHHIDKS